MSVTGQCQRSQGRGHTVECRIHGFQREVLIWLACGAGADVERLQEVAQMFVGGVGNG